MTTEQNDGDYTILFLLILNVITAVGGPLVKTTSKCIYFLLIYQMHLVSIQQGCGVCTPIRLYHLNLILFDVLVHSVLSVTRGQRGGLQTSD